MNQVQALRAAKKQFGTSAFTEHHINYCKVGMKLKKVIVFGLGDTWEQAANELQNRLDNRKY